MSKSSRDKTRVGVTRPQVTAAATEMIASGSSNTQEKTGFGLRFPTS